MSLQQVPLQMKELGCKNNIYFQMACCEQRLRPNNSFPSMRVMDFWFCDGDVGTIFTFPGANEPEIFAEKYAARSHVVTCVHYKKTAT